MTDSTSTDKPTTRERRAARAQRRRDWSSSRQAKAAASLARGQQTLDAIPLGQPIMSHTDANRRRKARESIGRGIEHQRMAERHEQIADSIDAANDRAIYRDDPDIVERLTAKLAGLETRRDRIKAYNRTCTKNGTPDPSILTERERAEITSLHQVVPYQVKNAKPVDGAMYGKYPSYVLSNLGATIRKERARLDEATKAQ